MKKLILVFTLIVLIIQLTNAQAQKTKTPSTQATQAKTTQAQAPDPLKTFQIKGVVVDSISGKGLPYATIGIQSGTQGIIRVCP